MKLNLSFQNLSELCIDLADRLKKDFNPDEIIAIARGGLVPATIMAKHLRLNVGVFQPQTKDLQLVSRNIKRIAFVEDLVAHGRTYQMVKSFMNEFKYFRPLQWTYVPILIDGKFNEVGFNYYGIKTNTWVVMPWEDTNKMQEGDRGLFRERSDTYGKPGHADMWPGEMGARMKAK